MRTLFFGAFSVLVVVGLLTMVSTHRSAPLSRMSVQLVLGSAVGALGALGVLTARIDLVPDGWEPMAVAVVGVAIVACVMGSVLIRRFASR